MGIWDDAQAALEDGLDLIAQDAVLGVKTRSGGTVTRPTFTTANHPVRIIDNGKTTDTSFGTAESDRSLQGGLIIQRVRHRVTITTKGGVVPERGNTLTFGGDTFTIDEVRTASPGGVDLTYTAYLEEG